MPISDPPKAVPWFGEDGDPLLPENRGVEVKPLLRLFDPYQTYDLLTFSSINFQLPIGKVRIDDSGESGTVADPFSLAGSDQYGLLAEGYYGLLVERFTPDNAPFADRYIDRLKEICDHLLDQAVKWDFNPRPLNDQPIPKTISIQDRAGETDTATVTFFYSDDDCLSKRVITLNSFEGEFFSWALRLDEPPTIAVYSMVITSSTGYLENLINNAINSQVPYLLFSNFDDFIQYFKEEINFDKAIKDNLDDPFNLEIFIKEYIEKFTKRTQIIKTFTHNVVFDREIYLSEYKILKDDKVFVPTVPIPEEGITQRWRIMIKEQGEALKGQFGIKSMKWRGRNNNLRYIGPLREYIFFPSDYTGEYFYGGVTYENNLDHYINFDPSRPPEQMEVTQVPREEWVEGEIIYLTRVNAYAALEVGENKFGQKIPNRFVRVVVEARIFTGTCIVEKIETTSETIKPFDFEAPQNKVVNSLQELGHKEINYNFASIVRANAYPTGFKDDLPAYAYVEKNAEEIKSIYVVADTTKDIPIASSLDLEIEREILKNTDDQDIETTEVTRQACKETETEELISKTTTDEQLEWRQTHTWVFDELTLPKKEDIITTIDRAQWEWEIRIDELSGEEITELIKPKQMPDSIRIKEIHRALEADTYSQYTLNGETFERKANLGYLVDRMSKLLGINVMPDASPYFPAFSERIEPDEQGEIDLPNEYGVESWREDTEEIDPLRVQNPDFEKYNVTKNNFAYKLTSRAFGEDPNTGEDTRLQEGGFILCHNIPQLLQAILTDFNEAFNLSELSASNFNLEDKLREMVKSQFSDDDDDEVEDGEALEAREVKVSGLLNLISAYLAVPYARAGFQDYPVKTPKSFVRQEGEEDYDPDDEGFDPKLEVKHQNYSEFYSWFMKEVDSLAGQFPIDIEIEDNDLIKTGNQKLEISLPNIAETLAELVGIGATNQALSRAVLNTVLRDLTETGSARTLGIKNNYMLQAISEYLGYKVGKKEIEVPFTFNPVDTVDKKDSKIDHKGEESLQKALEPKTIKMDVEDNIDDRTLEQSLDILIEGARIVKAQNYRTVDAKGDVKQQLKSIIKRAMEFIDSDDSGINDIDFDQWLEEVENEFSNTTKSEPDQPYGKDRKRRPKIRRVDTNRGEQQ
ncbi:MAG: hypothetical protein ACLFM2_08180 [Halothece sp.]